MTGGEKDAAAHTPTADLTMKAHNEPVQGNASTGNASEQLLMPVGAALKYGANGSSR